MKLLRRSYWSRGTRRPNSPKRSCRGNTGNFTMFCKKPSRWWTQDRSCVFIFPIMAFSLVMCWRRWPENRPLVRLAASFPSVSDSAGRARSSEAGAGGQRENHKWSETADGEELQEDGRAQPDYWEAPAQKQPLHQTAEAAQAGDPAAQGQTEKKNVIFSSSAIDLLLHNLPLCYCFPSSDQRESDLAAAECESRRLQSQKIQEETQLQLQSLSSEFTPPGLSFNLYSLVWTSQSEPQEHQRTFTKQSPQRSRTQTEPSLNFCPKAEFGGKF